MENTISPEQINILLVDDRPENIAALEAELAPLGHNLVGVGSGKAALREALARDFAAIILDVVMPEMDGYETASMIKARAKSQNIPIIFVTAGSDEPVKGYAVGAVDYIFKPFNPEILRAKVRAFVELYIAKEELAASKTLVEKARDELEARVRERTVDLQQALEDVKNTQKMLNRQEKLAAMGQLSAGVAHELRNPLNIIHVSTQLMIKEGLPAEAAERCKVIMEQVMRAAKIIDNLRDFARERKPETKKIDLCPLIKKTLSLADYEMGGEGIEVAKEFPRESIRVMGDEDQLAQVFLNIINNARDSMNIRKKSYSFGEMRRVGWRPKFTVRTLVEGGKARIRFEDNGVGIPEESKKKLFTLFFTTKGEATGTGLGIAIALGIIENHGGTIEFESEEGKGAVFEVTLPLAE